MSLCATEGNVTRRGTKPVGILLAIAHERPSRVLLLGLGDVAPKPPAHHGHEQPGRIPAHFASVHCSADEIQHARLGLVGPATPDSLEVELFKSTKVSKIFASDTLEAWWRQSLLPFPFN